MNTVLTDALDRILRWVERYKPHYLNFLQPGLSKAEIEDLAADLPFKLPPEVYQLYQWRNGATAGNLGQETAWLFANWTFFPLEDAIAPYQRSRDKAYGFPDLCDLTLTPFQQYRRVELFYRAGKGDRGYFWIDREAKFFPVTLENFQEGSLSIYIKYSSLTSMMLALAECYETATYTSEGTGYCFIECYNRGREHQIWKKYNSDIIEWALSTLNSTQLCGLYFIYFAKDLKEFRDAKIVVPIIEKLQLLLEKKNKKQKQPFDLFKHIERVNSKDRLDFFNYIEPEKEAVEILGILGDSRAVPIVTTVLDWDDFDDCWDVPRTVSAARALGRLKDQRATEPLIAMLSHRNSQVREIVIWALGRIQDIQAAESLIAALSDRALDVRKAAKIALNQMVLKYPELDQEISHHLKSE